MKPFTFWQYPLLAFLVFSCTSAPVEEEGTVPSPNVILVMCDDLGWGDVGFNGSTISLTPNLDKFVTEGMRLERFYAASAVCSPTRGSCLTGRNPIRLGIPTANAGHLKKEEITLAELLLQEGYATGFFGKWHLGTLTTQVHDANRGRPGDSTHYTLPTMHGFEEYFCTESKVPTYNPMVKPLAFQEEMGESLRYGWAAVAAGKPTEAYGTYYWQGVEKQAKQGLQGDDSKAIMDRALPFIENAAKADKPFFTVIWFHTPHLPVVADSAHRALYPNLSHREQLYYGAISAMDKQMGRLKEALAQQGIAKNTLLWFCSDNGPERDTPGSAGIFRERKRSLHEGGVRVPAFVYWPATIQPKTSSQFPMVTSDYLPTITDYLGIPYPEPDRPLDGISLKKALEGKQANRQKPIGFLFAQQLSWMTQQYKLISKDGGSTFELFDLLGDPSEENNLAPERPELVAQMQHALLQWQASCEASRDGIDFQKKAIR